MRLRHAHEGEDPVAEELVDRPPVPLDLLDGDREEAVENPLHGLASPALAIAVESRMSQKRSVTGLCSPDRVVGEGRLGRALIRRERGPAMAAKAMPRNYGSAHL